jgi:hypothetical protein
VRELASKNLGGKIVSPLSAKRTLRGNPGIRHSSNRCRNVLAALLATDDEVAATGFREIEHREEYRRTKGEAAMWIFSRQEPVETGSYERLSYRYYFQLLAVRRVDLKAQIWQDRGQVNGPLCELSPPPFALVSVCCWLFC